MLCRKFKQITLKPAANNVSIRSIILARQFSKKCINIFTFVRLKGSSTSRMSSTLRLRNILKDFVVTRLFSAWTRSYIVSSVVKRCRKERGVRDVLQCFRQTILRPKRTLLFTVTAAYKNHDEEPGRTGPCATSITDEELQELVTEFEGVNDLAQATLYCKGCAKRVVINNKQPGVPYCACKGAEPPEPHFDGWFPYMEAENVIIWRKEYKGKGMYAYKVYGCYKEIQAQDFAAIQVDGAYRRIWDTAVAALSIVERRANDISDQIILHWEVVWPRLFANRDYVYVRRHKEFNVETKCLPHKDGIFNETPCIDENAPIADDIYERPSVHSKAKRKAMEEDKKSNEKKPLSSSNKAYIIVSRSCVHPKVPETKNAVRVMEYWSHMVVRTLNGPGMPGMEFVLTYYDEPSVGGMPPGVASWATGRAAPAFLERMRKAAMDYTKWRARNDQQAPDFTPFGPEKVSFDGNKTIFPLNEQDMESSKSGPDLDPDTREQATQTDDEAPSNPTTPRSELSTFDVTKIVYPRQDKAVSTTDDKDFLDSTKKKPTPPPTPPQSQSKNDSTAPEKTPETIPVKTPENSQAKTPENPEKTAEVSLKSSEKSEENTKDSESEREETTSKEESEQPEEATGRWWRTLLPYLAPDD